MYIHLLRLKNIYGRSRDFQLSAIGLFCNYSDNWLSERPFTAVREYTLLILFPIIYDDACIIFSKLIKITIPVQLFRQSRYRYALMCNVLQFLRLRNRTFRGQEEGNYSKVICEKIP